MREHSTPRLVVDAGAPLADARAWATDTASALGAGEAELTVVALLTSEVVSNATRHGEGGAELEVSAVDGGVRVTVRDEGDGLPQVLHPDAGTPGGRGVWLVSELARTWGVELLPGGGKAVWFEVDVPLADDDAAGLAGEGGHGGGDGQDAEEDVAVLVLTGDVDADTRTELIAQVDAVLATGRPVVVRCERLDFIDSTGLAALSRLAIAAPEPPRVVGAPCSCAGCSTSRAWTRSSAWTEPAARSAAPEPRRGRARTGGCPAGRTTCSGSCARERSLST